MNVRFCLSYDTEITLKKLKYLVWYYVRNVIMNVLTLLNMKTTCGLSILIHVVISLTDVTSYDKNIS